MSTPNPVDECSPFRQSITERGNKPAISAASAPRGWQSALARRLDIDRYKVNDVLMGRRTSARVAAAIAAAVGVPASQLWPGKYKRLEHAEKAGPQVRRPE